MKNGTFYLDEVDIKILNLLQNDAKLTAKDLGDQIALSQTPVYERIKKLERQGVIRKYVALLEADALNKSLIVFMNITIREHGNGSRDAMVRQLIDLPEISELYHTSGQYDFMAKLRVSTIADYRTFLVDKMANIDNVKDINGQIVLEEVKHTTSLDLSAVTV